MKCFELFIDELGNTKPTDKRSELYVLCGCAVEQSERARLKTRADQIKFKYWGKTSIVFHSRELGLKEGVFSIFKKRNWENFVRDLTCFLKEERLTIFIVVVDKRLARKMGWNSIKVTKETARKLFYHYLSWLFGLKGGQGKITVESATSEKDRYYLNEFSYFLSPGCLELSVDYRLVKKVLTSISFVTKENADIEEQVADLFAYAAKCLYLKKNKLKKFEKDSYEKKMVEILEKKLFEKPKFAKVGKMKFYEAIEPFCVLPKK